MRYIRGLPDFKGGVCASRSPDNVHSALPSAPRPPQRARPACCPPHALLYSLVAFPGGWARSYAESRACRAGASRSAWSEDTKKLVAFVFGLTVHYTCDELWEGSVPPFPHVAQTTRAKDQRHRLAFGQPAST